MLYRLVRPMRRKGTRNLQRIPADLRDQMIGMRLSLPVGSTTVPIRITPSTHSIRVSLRTADPTEAKNRQAGIAGYLARVFAQSRLAAHLQDDRLGGWHPGQGARSITGHEPRTVGEGYGGVTLAAKARPMDGFRASRPARAPKLRPCRTSGESILTATIVAAWRRSAIFRFCTKGAGDNTARSNGELRVQRSPPADSASRSRGGTR
jgi:hypothetical protein